jgi:hypothetical protein
MPDRVICTVNQFSRVKEVISNLRRSSGRVDNLKVHGKKQADGSILLYWSRGRSSLRDRFSGRAAERRALARIAFKQLYDNERAKLRDDGILAHDHHRDAFATLLNGAGYDNDQVSCQPNKRTNRRAVTAHVLHAQLMGLNKLCEDMRAEHTRHGPAIKWCSRLSLRTESDDGIPQLKGLSYKRLLTSGGYGAVHIYRDEKGRHHDVKIISPLFRDR